MSSKRTKRMEITAENYQGIKNVVDQIPAGKKGNETIRNALNLSTGKWQDLRKSTDYASYEVLRQARIDYVKNLKKSEPVVVVPAEETTPPVNELVVALNNINESLIRLCEAWESTPSKKGWLK